MVIVAAIAMSAMMLQLKEMSVAHVRDRTMAHSGTAEISLVKTEEEIERL
jgi:hypothetical protein